MTNDDSMIPSPPLEEFRQRYEADDNEWWRLRSGDQQNLFDEACERIDSLEQVLREIRDGATIILERLGLP